jgi:hypothetical protein
MNSPGLTAALSALVKVRWTPLSGPHVRADGLPTDAAAGFFYHRSDCRMDS